MTFGTTEMHNILTNVFDKAPVGLMVINPAFEIILINDFLLSFLGLSHSVPDLYSLPAKFDELKSRILEMISKNKDIFLLIPKKSLSYCVEISIKPFMDGNIDYKLICIHDKTDDLRKWKIIEAMRDELNQYKNLAAMGTMVSGIAHELNNPVAGISMSSQLIETSLNKLNKNIINDNDLLNKDLMEYCLLETASLKANTERAARLVDDLLNYSRKEKLDLAYSSLLSIINDAIELTKYDPVFLKSSINLDCPEEIHLNCDKLKIQQVFYNILKNAAESFCEQGNIKITCKLQGNYVTISIVDDGCGVSSADMNQLFTPFFTTKGPKGGTGLGLSITQKIIERHGGGISVNSVVGSGTEFVIKLPVNLE